MVNFNLIQFLKVHCAKPDQTLRSAASDLVFHCMLMSHKKDTRLKWVNNIFSKDAHTCLK